MQVSLNPLNSFLPEPVSTPEPEFVPPPPEPNGFFPGINPEILKILKILTLEI
jgi:hypothetical protein